MADLRTDAAGMAELLAHLREREGAIEHFYCDHRGLVTIAIGYLVDRDGDAGGAGRQLAQSLAQRAGVVFKTVAGASASPAEVEADWQRVKDHGRANAGVPARRYAQVAHLRIDTPGVDAITRTVVTRFLDDLYQKRPFVLDHDVHLAMALLDARYNPAGVRIFGDEPQVARLWHLLDPKHAEYAPGQAPAVFEQIWAGRGGGERYQQRHQQRVSWMRSAVAHAGVAAPARAPTV